MRFIRGWLIAAGYVLVSLGSAQAVTVGETPILSAADNSNGNLLLAQSATLAQTATIQSLSFYVTTARGQLILGIYDATGPNRGPGTLKASTAIFTPTTGWNTAKVTPVSLTAGTYWLAYLPSSNDLSFVKTASGNCAYFSYGFGSMPSKFSTSPTSCTPATWSFYATLSTSAVNGACGSSNGLSLASAPATNLCSAGTASAVTGSGPWRWNCAGSNGGATASCSASLQTVSSPPPASGSTPFVALHTYYMSPTGNDSNNGTSAATPWATPNHAALVCGDVIVAAQGDYSSSWTTGLSSQPGSCPSSSRGTDGKGGIYFVTVLCAGNVGTCTMTGRASSGFVLGVYASNWAVEGFQLTSTSIGSSGERLFVASACASGTTHVHHVAFINDIGYHSQMGFGTDECAINHNVPGNGVDYFAVIGSIAQNSNNDLICLAAIDVVAPSNWNTNAGTHIILDGNFAINNQTTACGNSDIEGMMFDTFDAHGFVGTSVIKNNMIWLSGWAGLQIFEQSYNSSSPTINVLNNTLYANNLCTPFAVYATGEINVQVDGGFHWIVNVYNNISKSNRATTGCSGGGGVYAQNTGGAKPGTTVVSGGTGIQNIYKGMETSCLGDCDPGNNQSVFNGFTLGTNTYTDPGFANTSDLLTNRRGVPNCTGYANVTACMGWSYATQTARANTPIADLTATAGGTSGKGYQPPRACAPDSLYPTWLKGVVYLHWNGSSLTENADLVNKPCGM